MKLKPITLRWDDDARAFDTTVLDAFCTEHDVLSVFEHFFVHEGRPSWALLISYRPRPPGPHAAAVEAPRDPRVEVPPEARATFEAIRQWRNNRARDEGKPPYVLFTNNQLIAIARGRPTSKAALAEIHGVGESKLAAYGDEIVAILASIPVGADAPVEADDAP